MHPTLSAGTLKLLPNFLKEEGGLTGSHLLEGGAAGKEEVTFFRVGCSFYKKKKQTKIWNIWWQKKFINKEGSGVQGGSSR